MVHFSSHGLGKSRDLTWLSIGLQLAVNLRKSLGTISFGGLETGGQSTSTMDTPITEMALAYGFSRFD